jgi:hypothetical protein
MGDSAETSSKSQSSGPHWSKDYVEHLRTIHFSLIALSLAAVVLATSASPNEVSLARKKISAIGELIRIWNSDWVNKAAEQVVLEDKTEVDKLIRTTA